RHLAEPRHAFADARPFVVEEEEETVFEHRAADIAAELILNILRLLEAGAVIEKGAGVKDAIAEELIRRPVKSVAAALGRDADERAGAAAILRRVRVGAHLELLDRVHRRADDLRGQLLQ